MPIHIKPKDSKACESQVLSKGLYGHVLKLIFVFLIHWNVIRVYYFRDINVRHFDNL